MNLLFQSTLSRRERPDNTKCRQITLRNFNPRSHEESDRITYNPLKHHPLFQSTLSRRERLSACDSSLTKHGYFNPRSHEESDKQKAEKEYVLEQISIHALTKRATYPPSFLLTVLCDFNPRSHEESDVVDT